MTAPPLPDSWDDEPWPLDDPIPAPSLRPANWSDTHTDPPQVADLADEAWQRAVDRGISMSQALAELQSEAQYHRELDRQIIHGYRSAMGFATGGPIKVANTQKGDQALADVKRATIVLSYKWEPDQ